MDGEGAMDHVDETVGAIVLAELAHGHPPHLGGIAARLYDRGATVDKKRKVPARVRATVN